VIFDTSFLIDLIRGNCPEALSKARDIQNSFEESLIPTVVLLELWRGFLVSGSVLKKEDQIRSLLNSCTVVGFSEEDAYHAAKIEYDLKKSGKIIDLEDIMIAAAAISRNQKVLTRNVKHFERISGIEIETY
tara:strand:+ start:441 stop:836 length:396 start_codon:yes stop_codon:yes gene_type:complete